MKKLILLLLFCSCFMGCDYTVQLVDMPVIKIDKSLFGLWQRTNDNGQVEKLLILPMGEKEYMISFPADEDNAMFARASLWSGADMILVQLDWFGTAQAKLPKDNRTFQYAYYDIDHDSLTIRLLNPETVSKKADSAKELIDSIKANKDNANFRLPYLVSL